MPVKREEVSLKVYPMDFLATAGDPKHASMIESTMPPHFEAGLHVHAVKEETFHVIDRECQWQVGEHVIYATPGTVLLLPPGAPHHIAYVSDKPAEVLMSVSPPGHEH